MVSALVPSVRGCVRLAALVVAAGSLLAAGCGANGSVSGRVTYKGKPVPSGTVTFLTDDNKVFTSQIAADGTYNMRQVPRGPLKVGVQTPPSLKVNDPQMPPRKDQPDMPAPPPSVPIPTKYGDPNASGLTLDVTGGSQTHDISLP